MTNSDSNLLTSRTIWIYTAVLINCAFTFQLDNGWKFPEKSESYSESQESNNFGQTFVRSIRESSFFPEDNDEDRSRETGGGDEAKSAFRFPSSDREITDIEQQSTSSADISPRVINGNGQWSYNLPHPLVNDSTVASNYYNDYFDKDYYSHSYAAEKQSAWLPPRRSKLPATFHRDPISAPQAPSYYSSGIRTELHQVNNNLPPSPYRHHGDRLYRLSIRGEEDDSRGLSPESLAKITETLGAINTVGRYLVNYTRGAGAAATTNSDDKVDTQVSLPPKPNEDLPKAIYTISKNVLGRNMTDTIAPIVKGVAPLVSLTTSGKVTGGSVNQDGYSGGSGENGALRPCSTPDGYLGNCDDLSNCPQLLLNLNQLRQSICFKSLFVPGVCCPRKSSGVSGGHFIEQQKPKPEFGTIRPHQPATTTATIFPVVASTTVATTTTTSPPIFHTTSSSSSTTHRPPATAVIITASSTNRIPTVSRPTLTSSTSISAQVDDECGLVHTEKFRVVGGDESLPGRWPWMAAIFLRNNRRTEYWCGGTLIGPKYVLTAAHCTRDAKHQPLNAHQYVVRLGDIDLKRDDEPSSPETYFVTEVKPHPKFSRVGYYHDIAVLELDRPVRKTKYIAPICLPGNHLRNEKFVSQKATVVGWGTTYFGGKHSTVQRQADLPIWTNEDCDRTYFQPITDNFICAGLVEGGKDACQGDSGGPLMLRKDGRWIQIGIVSFGSKCGEPSFPGVYTRVTQYIDWIHDNFK